jgi:hypothetical protein
MKYLVRAIKYFFYFVILTSAIIAALVLIGAVENDINAIFEGGYTALWKIAVFFAAVAAVYPKVGFINRKVEVNRNWQEIREEAITFFKERRYEVESESADRITFRIKGVQGRLVKMNEDRITLRRSFDGYEMEGLRKDVLRLATGFEHRFYNSNEE